MSNRIGWGIIGYGVIGPHHAKAVADTPEAELLAVCDVDPSREKVLRERGFKARFYTSHREMLRREPGVQAVSICTPSGLHHRGAIDAARAGRHVLTEKPMDITLANMDRMIEACDRAGVKLGCIFQKRTDTDNILARQALRRGLLGKLVLGDCHQKYYRSPAYFRSAGWRGTWKLDGGGALMNQAVHGIDLLLWLMGEVDSVFTYTDRLVRQIEVEDTSVSVIRFKNGALGNIIGATSVVPGMGCKTMIHGERGSIILGDGPVKCWTARLVKGKHEPQPVNLEEKFHRRKTGTDAYGKLASDHTALSSDGHTRQVRDFCRAIRRNTEPMVPGPEARRAVELILAIYRSWKTRREVNLPLRG